jgi:alpha-tubulin suppressor-like RCC1 family protein
MLRSRSPAAFALLIVMASGCVEQTPPDPTCVDGRSRCVSQVSLGAGFGCALLVDRTVWCWGRNDESQLGYATTDLCPEALAGGQTRAVACHTFPFQVLGLDRAVRIATGGSFACAQRDDGTVRCWGANGAGQLGNGLTLPSQTPVTVRGLSGVTALAAGARHACAISMGRVWCWGANDRGQLGRAPASRPCSTAEGAVACESQPVLVEGLENVTALTAGAAHTCARIAEGLALCWGDARYGQLGASSASEDPSPMPVAVLTDVLPLESVRDLSAGPQHTCARDENGAVWCWGRNDHGELGVEAPAGVPDRCAGPCATNPTRVPSLESRTPDAGSEKPLDGALDASEMPSDTGRDAASDARGDSGRDARADATETSDASDASDEPADDASVRDVTMMPSPDAVAPPSMVPRAIAAGGTFACAVLDDGTVRCWGDDSDGQLGDGQRVPAPQRPVMVIATPGAARSNPLQNVSSLAAGASTACALLRDGSLRCWGSNQGGALGNGNTSAHSGPVPVTW